MSKVVQQKSQEFKTFTVEKRGKERDVRVPQLSSKLVGDALIRAVAKAAFDQTHENADKAIALMEEWVTADYKLNQRIVKPMVNLMCRESVDAIVRSQRPAIRGSVTSPSESLQDGISKTSKRNIMEFPIRFGQQWIRLGECTKDQLLDAANQREKAAETMNADAVWFRRIAKELDGKQKVQTVLKPTDVERFRDQAHKEVA